MKTKKAVTQNSRKTSEKGRGRLIVGRTILDLGHRLSELAEVSDKWHQHKVWVTTEFLNDQQAYYKRLGRLIEKAIHEQVDVLIFPACAFVWDDHSQVHTFLRMIRKIPWVVFGCLHFQKKSKGFKFSETACVFHLGKEITYFKNTKVMALKTGETSLMVAISSTIGKICDGEVDEVQYYRPTKGDANIAISLGHHQYSNRFLKTLRRVWEHLTKQGSEAIVILSYWKVRPTNSTQRWSIPVEPEGSEFHRCIIPQGRDGGEDFLDILSLK